MQIKKLFAVNPSLFDGAGAAAAAGGEISGDTMAGSANTRRSGSGEKATYGKQEPTAGGIVSNAAEAGGSDAGSEEKSASTVETGSNTQEERRRAYRALINGEYKDLYTQDTQRMINQRFRETKGLQEQLDSYQPLMAVLGQIYGDSAGDVGKLVAALENDNALWRQAAEKSGMDVQTYKEVQKLRRNNEALTEAVKRQQGQERMNRQLAQWDAEAKQLADRYSGFDLQAETQNPQFLAMLRSGVPMEHAYKVMHMDEIVNDAMTSAAASAEKRVVDNVRAKGARPTENGTAAQSGFLVKEDVSKLSRQERAELAKRALRGEKIRF